MSFIVLDFPIEPIEGRYSVQWRHYFARAYERNGLSSYSFMTLVPGMEQPEGEKFLDPFTTFQLKFRQLENAVKFIRDNRDQKFVVFLHDGWFPGIEMFAYLRDMEGIKIKLTAYWHAGSYSEGDLLKVKNLQRWVRGSERTWFNLCDAIFVGTDFHKNQILGSLGQADGSRSPRVYNVGSPLEIPNKEELLKIPKKDIVIWPHRISEDKHPEVFERLAKESQFKDWVFLRTKNLHLNKSQYYEILASSRVAVSTATHENFGISMSESALLGCYPICPNALAYRETMEPHWRYNSYEELKGLIASAMNRESPYLWPHRDKYKQQTVTDNICSVIKEIGSQ